MAVCVCLWVHAEAWLRRFSSLCVAYKLIELLTNMCHLSDRLRQILLVACSHNTMRKQLYSFVIVVTMLEA